MLSPRRHPQLAAALAAAWLCALSFAATAVEADGADGADEQAEAEAAAGVDTSRWQCRLCPWPEGWYGTLEFGPGWVGEDSLKFGSYRGLDEEGFFPALGGDAHYRDGEGRYLDLYLHDLGIDNRRVDLRGGEQGRYEIRLGWREIPFYRGHRARTPFLGVGTGTLTLPAGWQPATTTGAMPDLAASLRDVALGLERQRFDAGLTFEFASRWNYEIDYAHEEKEGTRPFGAGAFLFNAAHFPAPVDFTTDRFDMGLSVTGERGHLRFGFAGSEFDNGHDSITWQNPFTPAAFTPADDTGILQAALEPDNRFYQFSLAGVYAPSHRLRFSGRAAWGRMEQNDPFLPRYSVNPAFSDLPLPRLSLQGEVDVRSLRVAGRMSAQLGDRLDLVASVKLDERDNDTPVDTWTPVITDLLPRGPSPNLPYGFRREKYRLELGHRTTGWLRLSAGAESERIERTFQEVAKTRERTGWVQAGIHPSIDPWTRASLRIRLETAHRDPSAYQQLPNGGLVEHPLQRKFHLADRDRDRAVVELDLAPVDRLGVGLSWYRAVDDYDESVIGLQQSSDDSVSLDVSWSANDATTLYAFATREDIESTMTAAVSPQAAPWHGRTDDAFLTLGAGVDHAVNDRLSVGFDYVYADADGRVAVDPAGAGVPPFPDLETRLRNARLHLGWRFNAEWSARLYAEYEHYDSADWYIDGLGVDGIPAILTMGTDSPDYRVVVLRMLATLRF